MFSMFSKKCVFFCFFCISFCIFFENLFFRVFQVSVWGIETIILLLLLLQIRPKNKTELGIFRGTSENQWFWASGADFIFRGRAFIKLWSSVGSSGNCTFDDDHGMERETHLKNNEKPWKIKGHHTNPQTSWCPKCNTLLKKDPASTAAFATPWAYLNNRNY